MLWSVRFDQCLDEALQAQYRALLSPDELLRLSRFVFERDRHRHLVSRALVRVVLGRRLGIDASALAFGATPQGKPTLTSPPHAGLTFNLTHSGNRAILAISQGLDVGVDVEAIKHKAAPIEIGHRQFAPFESQALSALADAPDQQSAHFWALWTLKESLIKATGMGLSTPLHRFGFALSDTGEITLHSQPNTEEAGKSWWFGQWQPDAEHLAAVCLEQPAGGRAAPPIIRAAELVPLRTEYDCPLHFIRASSHGC